MNSSVPPMIVIFLRIDGNTPNTLYPYVKTVITLIALKRIIRSIDRSSDRQTKEAHSSKILSRLEKYNNQSKNNKILLKF